MLQPKRRKVSLKLENIVTLLCNSAISGAGIDAWVEFTFRSRCLQLEYGDLFRVSCLFQLEKETLSGFTR